MVSYDIREKTWQEKAIFGTGIGAMVAYTIMLFVPCTTSIRLSLFVSILAVGFSTWLQLFVLRCIFNNEKQTSNCMKIADTIAILFIIGQGLLVLGYAANIYLLAQDVTFPRPSPSVLTKSLRSKSPSVALKSPLSASKQAIVKVE